MSTSTSTTTRLSANGETEVVHPDIPRTFVRIFKGGKGFELYGEQSDVTMTSVTCKSYRTMEQALGVARRCLDGLAARMAE